MECTTKNIHTDRRKCTHTHTHTLAFLKDVNNCPQERRLWGTLWHIAATNLPAAWGSAEWTQLGSWFGARAEAPQRQADTAKELRQRKKKVYHTNGETYSHSYLHLCFHTLVFHFLIKQTGCMSRICHPRVPAVAPVNACTLLLFVVVLFWGGFSICRLAPCSCPCCVSPQWQGHPILPDGPPTQPAYTHFIKVDVTVLKSKWHSPLEHCTNTFCPCSKYS